MDKLSADFLAPFGAEHISLMQTIVARMRRFGLDPSAVESIINAYVHDEQQANLERSRPSRRASGHFGVCPDCGAYLKAMPVNRTRCTMVGGSYTMLIYCSNEECQYSRMR